MIGDLAPRQSRISSVVTVSFRQGEHDARLVPFELVFLSSGIAYWSDTTEALVTDVRLARDAGIPMDYRLEQNYPNPFNPSTTIRYELPSASLVRLIVYDILGRVVSVLVVERKGAGSYEVKFDAGGLASGLYVYRLQAGDFVQTRKLRFLQ